MMDQIEILDERQHEQDKSSEQLNEQCLSEQANAWREEREERERRQWFEMGLD